MYDYLKLLSRYLDLPPAFCSLLLKFYIMYYFSKHNKFIISEIVMLYLYIYI